MTSKHDNVLDVFTTQEVQALTTSQDYLESQIKQELINELKKLDIGANEAKILIFLMSNGSTTASDIARHTGIQRTDTYHYLSSLLAKGVVLSSFGKPQKYYALSFDEVIDCLVQSKYDTLKTVLNAKKECQEKLDKIIKVTQPEKEENGYQVLNEEALYSRIKKMLGEVSSKVTVYLSQKMLVKFYHAEIADAMVALPKRGVHVRIRTETKNQIEGLEGLESMPFLNVLHPLPVNFIIFDDSKMIIITEDKAGSQNITGFYTNKCALTSTFEYLFDRMT
ncbi:MAG: helix-turn-helix domain-containing protein [Thermoproteota archaeon]